MHALPPIPVGRALLSALLISGLLVQPLAGQGAWELDPEVIHPSEREKHTLTQMGDKVYCYGGKDAAGNPLGDLWAFDLTTQSWSQVSPTGAPPPARHSHQAVALGQSLYILFGKGAAGALSDIWRYNSITNAWVQRASTGSPLPAGRFDFTAVRYLGARITIYGGYTADGVFADANAWHYTTTTGAWQQRAANPSGPVAATQAVVFINPSTGEYQNYIAGGVTPAGLNPSVQHYDPVADTWSAVPVDAGQPPPPLEQGGTVMSRQEMLGSMLVLSILMWGGFLPDDSPSDGLHEVFVNPATNTVIGGKSFTLPSTITNSAAAASYYPTSGALGADWAKGYALSRHGPPVVEWNAAAKVSRLFRQPPHRSTAVPAVCVSGVSPLGGDAEAVTASTHTAGTAVLQPADVLALLKPGAFFKAALPAALALPSLSLTGNGADGAPLSEFLIFGGRVDGAVSAQQARFTAGNIYFPPTVEPQPGGLLRISWPDSILGGVTLQDSATLTPSTSWADTPGTPTHGTGIYYLDVNPASYNGGKHFFRLKAP